MVCSQKFLGKGFTALHIPSVMNLESSCKQVGLFFVDLKYVNNTFFLILWFKLELFIGTELNQLWMYNCCNLVGNTLADILICSCVGQKYKGDNLSDITFNVAVDSNLRKKNPKCVDNCCHKWTLRLFTLLWTENKNSTIKGLYFVVNVLL